MRSHGRYQIAVHGWTWCVWLVVILLSAALPGRADWLHLRTAFKPSFKPKNIWQLQDEMDARLRRVVVLPLTVEESVMVDEDTRRMLARALQAELVHCRHFEVATVPSERLRDWIGQTQFRVQEVLPARLFTELKGVYGADLVLFVDITSFQAYPPLCLGWHLKLVTADGSRTWWEADVLFDGAQADVVRGAQEFSRDHARAGNRVEDGWYAAHSPRLFAEYSAHCLLATLPRRAAHVLH